MPLARARGNARWGSSSQPVPRLRTRTVPRHTVQYSITACLRCNRRRDRGDHRAANHAAY